MPTLTTSTCWTQLLQHQQTLSKTTLAELFARDAKRFDHFSLHACGLLLDYSKNHLTTETLTLLTDLAKSANVAQALAELNAGKIVNRSERRAASHMALRDTSVDLDSITHFVDHIHKSSITDIVNIGIGGSDLGPAMACTALKQYSVTKQRFHFVSHLDTTQINSLLATLNPDHTLFIVSSKSFTTEETLRNAKIALTWLGKRDINQHVVAVTANTALAAKTLGLTIERIFAIAESVGGRYSLWSAIGLPIALQIGIKQFRELLAGAHAMDQHTLTAPLLQNMPVMLALLNIWYVNFWHASTHAILPYDARLEKLPMYLQQLEMESNGKNITQEEVAVDYQTSPIIWGSVGTDGQHAFHQLLHQGTVLVPIDFIVTRKDAPLFAHCLSQSRALMQGQPGNRPSSIIALDELTPSSLGALIALYEHKVFVNATIWEINPFDQWGVELGKKLATSIYPQLEKDAIDPTLDSSTQGLIKYFRQRGK